MDNKVFLIRVKKPSKGSIFLIVSLLLAAALLLLSFVFALKYFKLANLEAELAAVQGDLQKTHEELRQLRAAARKQQNSLEETAQPSAQLKLGRIPSGPEILAETPVIAHAMGAVNWEGDPYFNSLEAFQASYAAGIRVFEVDLQLTRDGKVALLHDWDFWRSSLVNKEGDISIPTLEEFLATPIQVSPDEEHTPLSFRSLLNLMIQYPDICVITDTKDADPDMIFLQFSSMLADAEELGLTNLFDRIIVQIYSRSMRQCLDTLYPFPHFIYTLYHEGQPDSDRFRDTAAYCAETGVLGITMPTFWWDDSFASIAAEYGVKVFVHTPNNIDEARSFLEHGISAVYTNRLTPDSIE